MITQFDDVKISYLLHKLIYQTGRDLKNISKLPYFIQKTQLAQKLLFSRVRFARFLVLYRWVKYNPNFNADNSNSKAFFCEKNYFENIKLQNQMPALGNQPNFANIQQQFMNQSNLSQPPQKFLYDSNNQTNIFQNLLSFLDNYKETTHIQMIYAIKKIIYINAHPYYQLILKIKEKSFKITRIRINWDKNFSFPSENFKNFISHFNHLDVKNPNELLRIDSFLYSFYIIFFFCKIVKKLIEISESFNCQILRESNNTILINFPNSFHPSHHFILRINDHFNRIEIFSKNPLFQPPKNPQTINESFEKLDDDTFIPMKMYNRMIDVSKDFDEFALLSELRDLVFYTNVMRFWNFLKKEIRMSIFPNFQILLKCNSESIYFIKILFIDKPDLLLTIIFQSKDGLPIFVPISKFYNLENVKNNLFLDIKKVFTSIFIQYIDHIDFSYIFKSHALSLMRKFELIDSLNYRINFSFSDHFYIVKQNSIFFPTLTLRSIDNPVNLNPRTILIKRFIKSYEIITNNSITSKIFLILLEIERKLKLKGIANKRTLNTIYIATMECKFKIDLNEYWSICFKKPLVHGVSNGQIVITGNKLSLRFVDSIINMIIEWYRFGLLIYIFRHHLIYTDDIKIYLKSFGYHFYIIYEPFFYDYYYFMDSNITHCLKVLPFRYPSSHMKVMMYTPFSSYAQYLNNEDDISSYFYCSLYYQLKISEIFNSKKWKVIPFIGEESFTLVYENQYSMVFQIGHNDFHFFASVFMIGNSSLLLVPLSRLFQFHENKTPVITIKMSFFDLEKVKLEIEKFDDLIKSFKLMKIDHLFYNNGKVFGKGTRFYLVQAVLDLNGIIISSPSFPSLVKITQSLYNLNISFESKKKFYNYVISILLLEEKYIVESLWILKDLIEPHRINKLDWEEMSNYLKIDSKKCVLEIMIIEDQEKIFIKFDDPINESVLVIKNGREKRFNPKEFDDIYLQMNPDLSISSQFNV